MERKGQAMSLKGSRILWGLAGLVLILAIAAVAAGPIMSMVEQPEYKVVRSNGAIEVREYGSMIAAEVEVDDERQPAINEGFRLIAAYIFGANKPNAEIEMTALVVRFRHLHPRAARARANVGIFRTTSNSMNLVELLNLAFENKPGRNRDSNVKFAPPVQQQREQTIAMTAPVTQQSDGGTWTVRFIMPNSWSMDTLPAPNDARVKLVPVPAKRMVAIRFSWRATDSLIAQKTRELGKYVRDEKLITVGEPVLAYYNPPWTLPFLRRNEIMLELAGT